MAYTAKDVATLRDQTGAGMMACKKALDVSDGNMEKATEYLREQGVAVAAKKATRIASEGVVCASIANGNIGALVEINCESDFVAKSDVFVDICNSISTAIAQNQPKDLDAALQLSVKGETVLNMINNATAKVGEKISLRRFEIQKIDLGLEEAYIHMGGKVGVLLEILSDKDITKNAVIRDMAHDIAMHIAAFSPTYINKDQVPQSVIDYEKDILIAQLKNDPKNSKKPADVLNKIVEGRISKFYVDNCLLYQEFAKDSTITVEQFIANTAKAEGVSLTASRFISFTMGEGLEKKQDNLADEVAKLSQK